uniref:Uncharacterized protein n=1 Tax=viral metagenome TaxID=1070528 RepID=A0A6C0C376_9ZZZZ
MKFYETSFKDYIEAKNKHNIHKKNEQINNMENTIFYGPSGTGKYSYVLDIIKKFSNTNLKYEKKVTCTNDKQEHIYKMSDIHFEIDFSLLGCNSKQIWNDIYIQINEIVALRQNNNCIIMCKNFHKIHSELLDLFYSYIEQGTSNIYNINIYFYIITEHISFIPYNILNACNNVSIQKPKKQEYVNIIKNVCNYNKYKKKIEVVLDNSCIGNIKELYCIDSLLDDTQIDIFNIINNNIINFIVNFKNNPDYLQFRELLYDILTYEIVIEECILYIYSYFIENKLLSEEQINILIQNTHENLCYYNNNYRPIYHLERMFYKIIDFYNRS